MNSSAPPVGLFFIMECDMALGYADPTAVENKLASDRIGVDEFTTWHQ